MGTQAHIIQKQRLNLKIQGGDDAYDVQTRFLNVFKSKVLPVLEAELDALVGPDEVIRIEQLQLDLGEILRGNMDTELPKLVREQIKEQLGKLRRAAAQTSGLNNTGVEVLSGVGARIEMLEKFLHTGLIDWRVSRENRTSMPEMFSELLVKHPEQVRELMQRILGAHRVRQRLSLQFSPATIAKLIALLLPGKPGFEAAIRAAATTFLAKYSLINVPDARPVQQLLAEYSLSLAAAAAFPARAAQILRSLPEASRFSPEDLANLPAAATEVAPHLRLAALRFLLHRSTQSQAALQQKIAQLPTSRLIELLNAISAADHSASHAQAADAAPNLAAWAALDTVSRTKIWTALLVPEVPALHVPPQRREKMVHRLLAAHLAGEIRTEAQGALLPLALQKLVEISRREKGAADVSATTVLQALAEVVPEIAKISPAMAAAKKSPRKKPRPEAKEQEFEAPVPNLPEEIYLENAGLVLLNPFFAPLFKDLGWVEGEAFLDVQHAGQAAVLLQYIATGKTACSEEQLVLNKILVGLPPETPINCDWVPDAEIQEKANHLLESAIHHWPQLGKVEPDQLRGTFLLREGRLSNSGENWQLKVERKAFDVLLEFLPWSYGIVKLPWMSGLVTVDW